MNFFWILSSIVVILTIYLLENCDQVDLSKSIQPLHMSVEVYVESSPISCIFQLILYLIQPLSVYSDGRRLLVVQRVLLGPFHYK